ncbi:UDP-N-acetylenolpyruvoylglucosamine reductase [Chloroherpeton thalassium ATCC 35110]|uniref:UDP-N-acetylenolpyruvoylglucosamine reductase n=1 Tax=Chloroherpeton thalassium (strain ATCC 35110 / GB-78) TaxID=517418 RepID=MURB_CHLT3|nr:UDP-N-acetylmuramate dehydrogenase [Chloroherpeton thalassium]B3QWU0.1 RecName: Full=UDP-N-acetylenolpyruvoylglucosamine reductase; AltName: Full=UDP-N-acetylmuramate dehydrogenase [Chloroherpeton thalassium ATCC 35110]ACF13304.1 UDP-N-acetylenolpyruvoylglucosamine reductase [Chloroherpeton thalassium ATCC 35110]
MISIADLREVFRGDVKISASLAEHSAFKIGGKADIVLKPLDKADAINVIKFFHEKQKPHIVLGRGSNVLISDDGVREAVILLSGCLEKVDINGELVYAEAGVDLQKLAVQSLNHRLGGLEAFSGVPGSVGGAIVMNAGAHGHEIFELIDWVEVVRDGSLKKLRKNEIKARYRETDLAQDTVLSARLKLKPISEKEQAECFERRRELMEKRRNSQPLSLPNVGSIFKNPPPYNGESRQFAGQLIEACGLKGVREGGAMISDKHANFIVNLGNATASDVLALIELAKTKVRLRFGIDLELEIKLIGFTEHVEK